MHTATESDIVRLARATKALALTLAATPTFEKNAALEKIAQALENNQALILEANARDIAQGQAEGLSKALIDRLSLNARRIHDLVETVQQIVRLPDPVGTLLDAYKRPNGLHIEKVRVPLGLVAIIYEARPNVTVDAAALALKSGNCVLLRGSRSALNTNRALVEIMQAALVQTALDPGIIALVTDSDRAAVSELLQLRGIIDVVIPRGGSELIQRVVNESRIPVLETGEGNCHVYVDGSANLDHAVKICYNAKVQRPSVCNAAETFLFQKPIAAEMVRQLFPLLRQAGVDIRADESIRALDASVTAATEQDFDTEFLDLIVAVKVVADVNAACAHIRRFGTQHTEAIVAEDPSVIDQFKKGIDCAAVMINASTRFTDGGEFGFGAEMGISTQKLHARGPLGLPELCTYQYVVTGQGHIRS